MQSPNLNKIFEEIREKFSPDEKWLNSQKEKFSSHSDGQFNLILSILSFNNFAMNKKFMAIVAVGAIALAGLVGVPAAAQAEEVGPGDFLYPVDLALENVQLALTNKKGDVVLLQEQLDERVQETEDGGGTTEEVSQAMELYNQKVQELEDLLASLCQTGSEDCNSDMQAKIENVGFATLKHIEVLANVYDKQIEKGNENAADAIFGAMENSLNGHDQAVESLQKSKSKGGDDSEESSVTDEELKAGKDKAKQKIEEARARGRERGNKK